MDSQIYEPGDRAVTNSKNLEAGMSPRWHPFCVRQTKPGCPYPVASDGSFYYDWELVPYE